MVGIPRRYHYPSLEHSSHVVSLEHLPVNRFSTTFNFEVKDISLVFHFIHLYIQDSIYTRSPFLVLSGKMIGYKKNPGKSLTITRNKKFRELQGFRMNESLVMALIGLETERERMRLI